MRILGIGITPPPGAKGNPVVTPELLASCLARYSRSNKGIDSILASIDWNDPDKSVDRIFKFVDYGHASITGMTGGIAIVVDGCTMFLAYKLFELAQQCDGQESSTRYIKLDASNLPGPEEIGIPAAFAAEWREYMELSFNLYHETYERLDREALANPGIVRVPEGADEKVVDRLRKNYALDRARYYIPFATKTSVALVMSARAWSDVIRQLESLKLPEARLCAQDLRAELGKFTPRLSRHNTADTASIAQADQMVDYAAGQIKKIGVPVSMLPDEVFIAIENSVPPFLPQLQPTSEAFRGKINRYSTLGTAVRRTMVRVAWNNMAIAELRDLNRHRTGYRLSPLVPAGFYIPPIARHPLHATLLVKMQTLLQKLAGDGDAGASACYVYGLLLGTQVAFEHSTHLDKFIYEIELRTGMGSHFRYAEHLDAAHGELLKKLPGLAGFITVGTAEPE